jgi:hypothetical protein
MSMSPVISPPSAGVSPAAAASSGGKMIFATGPDQPHPPGDHRRFGVW